MRMICTAIALPLLVGAAAAQPPALGPEVSLPYPACRTMAPLRTNLSATPDPTARSDAILNRLGVRCVGAAAPRVRTHY
jgi:hypothetical protein